jgi:hypothetical protein
VIYPVEFDVSGISDITATTPAGLDGTFTVAVNGQTITYWRNNNGAPLVAGALSFNSATVLNPAVAGLTGTFTYRILNGIGGIIDEKTDVVGITISAPVVPPAGGGGGTGGGGGGGGGGGLPTSNSTTSSVASNISTVEGSQTFSRPVAINEDSVTTDETSGSQTAQITSSTGQLTLKPNSEATNSLTIPKDTTVEGSANWDRRISPPLNVSETLIKSTGAKIEGEETLLTRQIVDKLIQVGSPTSTLKFSNPVKIETATDLPEGTVVNIYTSGSGVNWIAQGTATVKNGMLVFWTDHLSYFALVPVGEGGVPIAAAGVIPAQDRGVPRFNDVIGHWAETYINELADRGVVNGKSAGTFAPDDYLSRAELLKIALLAYGVDVPAGPQDTGFSDVDPNAWYAPYIKAAKDLGMISGNPDGTFRPNSMSNKAEALKMLIKTAGLDVSAEPIRAYADVPEDAWFTPYISWAINHQVIYSYRDNTVRPSGEITRAEAAKYTVKILQML